MAAFSAARAGPALVKALARAFRYQRLLDGGGTPQSARWQRGYLGTLLRLALLAPNIVEGSIDGRQPEGMDLPRLLASFPVGWAAQHQAVEPGWTSAICGLD